MLIKREMIKEEKRSHHERNQCALRKPAPGVARLLLVGFHHYFVALPQSVCHFGGHDIAFSHNHRAFAHDAIGQSCRFDGIGEDLRTFRFVFGKVWRQNFFGGNFVDNDFSIRVGRTQRGEFFEHLFGGVHIGSGDFFLTLHNVFHFARVLVDNAFFQALLHLLQDGSAHLRRHFGMRIHDFLQRGKAIDMAIFVVAFVGGHKFILHLFHCCCRVGIMVHIKRCFVVVVCPLGIHRIRAQALRNLEFGFRQEIGDEQHR